MDPLLTHPRGEELFVGFVLVYIIDGYTGEVETRSI